VRVIEADHVGDGWAQLVKRKHFGTLRVDD
jgi:hypothetical protein